MSFFKSLFGRPEYWAWESQDSPFGISPSIRMHTLDAHGKPHKDTLLKIGPWYHRQGWEDLLRALFKDKGCSALIDLTDKQIKKIFGRSKKDVIDTFLSGGYVSAEPYMIGMVLIASKLRKKHGPLNEVHFSEEPHRIELIYDDNHRIVVAGHDGHPDITMINFGYSGTGPDCLYSFLNESGFNVTMQKLEKIKTPSVLKRPAK